MYIYIFTYIRKSQGEINKTLLTCGRWLHLPAKHRNYERYRYCVGWNSVARVCSECKRRHRPCNARCF